MAFGSSWNFGGQRSLARLAEARTGVSPQRAAQSREVAEEALRPSLQVWTMSSSTRGFVPFGPRVQRRTVIRRFDVLWRLGGGGRGRAATIRMPRSRRQGQMAPWRASGQWSWIDQNLSCGLAASQPPDPEPQERKKNQRFWGQTFLLPSRKRRRHLQQPASLPKANSFHAFTLSRFVCPVAERRKQPRKPCRSICQRTWLGERVWTEFIAADAIDH